MSTPIIYSNNQYVAVKHSFITIPENINMSLTSLANIPSSNAMTIINGNVGIGTTNPRQLLDIQGGNAIINGNVGIGTTIPLYNLHINGSISATRYNFPTKFNTVIFKTLTEYITQTVNWSLPTNFKYITFEMWGGGGGGGLGIPYSTWGDGGEGGDYAKITFPFTVFSGISILTLNIGAGGAQGAVDNGGNGGSGQTTSVTWGGGVYSVQAFGGKGGAPRSASGTAYNFSQKTYTNRNTYDIIIPGGYGGVYSTNSTLVDGTNNSIATGISRNYNGTGGGGAKSPALDAGKGGFGGYRQHRAALGAPGENYFSSIENTPYGGSYIYIVGGGGGGGVDAYGGAGNGGYPGGGGGGAVYSTFPGIGAGGLIRITWYQHKFNSPFTLPH